MNKQTQPLYTTIETEFYKNLLSAKYALDCITRGIINGKHIVLVCDSLMKAKTKHPHFADIFTNNDIKTARSTAFFAKKVNDDREANGKVCVATDILYEEVNEAEEAFLNGDRHECAKELADTAAVVFRMMEMNDEEAKK